MDDRRSEERLEVSLDAIWDGKSGNYTARITDLSEGGCFVDTLGQADIGERLHIRFQLTDGSWLELAGKVAHHLRPVGFGLRFSGLSDQQLERLRSFLASDSRANLS